MLSGLKNPEVGGVWVRRRVVSCVDVTNSFFEVGLVMGGVVLCLMWTF